jgi:hypothetical protein
MGCSKDNPFDILGDQLLKVTQVVGGSSVEIGDDWIFSALFGTDFGLFNEVSATD